MVAGSWHLIVQRDGSGGISAQHGLRSIRHCRICLQWMTGLDELFCPAGIMAHRGVVDTDFLILTQG
jgi:hypothetical protein